MVIPLSSLPTAARQATVAFDLDGTLAPNSGRLCLSYLSQHHRLALLGAVGNPVSLALLAWLYVPKFGSLRPLLKWAQWLSQKPFCQKLLVESSEQSLGPQIFPRMAEELALRRANLQTTVLITGGFRPFAEPLLRRLQTDHLYVNDSFWPVPVTGRKKPRILQQLFSDQGLVAHAVYTDSSTDLPMITKFPWDQVFVVEPDPKFRTLAEQKGWTILGKAEAHPHLAASVRTYAAEVIRGTGDYAASRSDFYRRLAVRMKCEDDLLRRFLAGDTDQDPTTLQDLLAGVGLYLTEPVEVRLPTPL